MKRWQRLLGVLVILVVSALVAAVPGGIVSLAITDVLHGSQAFASLAAIAVGGAVWLNVGGPLLIGWLLLSEFSVSEIHRVARVILDDYRTMLRWLH